MDANRIRYAAVYASRGEDSNLIDQTIAEAIGLPEAPRRPLATMYQQATAEDKAIIQRIIDSGRVDAAPFLRSL